MTRLAHQQGGVMLIEALIGILIFAIGVLTLIAMQATAIRATQDARYRTEAVNYANDLLNNILIGVDRTSPGALQASLAAFQHQPANATNCSFNGTASTHPQLTAWAQLVTGTSGLTPPPRLPLPGTTAEMLQVRVDTSPGAFNTVTISICWRAPDDPVARRHVLISYIT